jgi:TPP-dependent pyruvate/acetoin dehydrogenase alpha subunit
MYEKLYKSLFRIRRVEEELARLYPTDKIKSPMHLSIGQESISVGVCAALQSHDIVFGTYRSHALYLAKGGDLKKMIAELYGKATGCTKGKGGSMHLISVDVGMMGTSAVVGTTIPQAVGYAYALKLQRRDAVVVSFFGDGATEEGVYHECLNFAALKHLPIIFLCENNSYAIHTHQLKRQLSANLCERARTYGMPAEQINDGDVLRIFERTHSMVQLLRTGNVGPFFLECLTYRWKEHVGPNEDFHLGYRSEEEGLPWKKNDQVARLAEMVAPAVRYQIVEEVEREISEAFAFAESSPFPNSEELTTDLFKET